MQLYLQLFMYLGICYAVSTSTIHFRNISLQINAVVSLLQFWKQNNTKEDKEARTQKTLKFWVLHLTNFKPMCTNNKTLLKETQAKVNQK